MTARRAAAAAVAVICGAELVIAIVIGGAGLSALVGWEAGVVAISIALLLFELVRRQRLNAEPTK